VKAMLEPFCHFSVHFCEKQGDSNVQYRLVGWGSRHRYRCSQARRLCLISGAIPQITSRLPARRVKETKMNSIIWLVGAVVIVLAILSFIGIG